MPVIPPAMPITLREAFYMLLVDTLVVLNRWTIRTSLINHNCSKPSIKCDMLERMCGAPWSLLIEERRQRLFRYTGDDQPPE